MKYDSQLTEVKSLIPNAKNILVTLPAVLTVDKLAASLALMLALNKANKEVTVVTEGMPLVSHSNLYGVGEVKSKIDDSGSGNFIISLEGVVEPNGQIPSLEKLDWYPEGSNLNLVFHALPGQTFEPVRLTSSRKTPNQYDAIFVIGATSLNELGSIYDPNIFQNGLVINIDNNPTNQNFGRVNIVDNQAGSVSEMIMQIFPSLSLSLDNDIASNIVAGVYDATNNLTNAKPDSFIVVGQAMQAGAKLPQPTSNTPAQEANQPTMPIAQESPKPVEPLTQQRINIQPNQDTQKQGFDLSQVLGMPPPATTPSQESFISPNVANSQNSVGTNQTSYEERPTQEFATSHSPESEANPAPDWLTPKIFKGGSLG